jgi:hypothetical protein
VCVLLSQILWAACPDVLLEACDLSLSLVSACGIAVLMCHSDHIWFQWFPNKIPSALWVPQATSMPLFQSWGKIPSVGGSFQLHCIKSDRRKTQIDVQRNLWLFKCLPFAGISPLFYVGLGPVASQLVFRVLSVTFWSIYCYLSIFTLIFCCCWENRR